MTNFRTVPVTAIREGDTIVRNTNHGPAFMDVVSIGHVSINAPGRTTVTVAPQSNPNARSTFHFFNDETVRVAK